MTFENNNDVFFKRAEAESVLSMESSSLLENKMIAILNQSIQTYFDLNRSLEIRRKSKVYNEIEAAEYLRLVEPCGSGRQSIRYYALTAKTLAYVKIGRDGLLFLQDDLDLFVKNQRVQTHRNS